MKIINKIRENLGKEALEKIIDSTGRDNILKYQEIITDNDSLQEKVKKLALIREKEGYMADYQVNEDGSFLLVENHCPICAAAKTCQCFCKAELNAFQTVLGGNVKIERISHILAGERRCAYLIKE